MSDYIPLTFLLILVLVISPDYSLLLAQGSIQCGSKTTTNPSFDSHHYKEYEKVFLDDFRNGTRRSINEIPVRIHIVGTDDGTGSLKEWELDMLMEEVNDIFIHAGIRYNLCGPIHYLNSDRIYDFNMEQDEPSLTKSNIPNMINIYFVNSIIWEFVPLCGFAFFPWDQEDYIVISNDCAVSGGLLAHELGHYFGLYHTHELLNGKEFVDGSNCDKAGDLLCDTKADPLLGYFNVTNGCTYNGYERDPKGAKYEPSAENIMSYTRFPCLRQFTPQQFARMAYHHETMRSNLGCPNFFPDLSALELEVNDATFRSGEKIEIDLQIANLGDTLSNASSITYYFSKDKTPNKRVVYNLGEVNINNLEKGKEQHYYEDFQVPLELSSGDYYLLACLDKNNRIDESNENNNCLIHKISIDNQDLGISNFYPNPVQNTGILFLSNESRGNFEIELRSSNGKVIKKFKKMKSGPELHFEISLENMPQGVYFVFLRKEKEVYSYKVLRL